MKNDLRLTAGRHWLVILLVLSLAIHSGCGESSVGDKMLAPAGNEPAASKGPETAPTVADAATILHRREVPILCYHQLRDFRPTDSKTARDYIVPPANFREQIRILADSGYHAILPDQLFEYLAFGKTLPSKPVMITFDDTRLEHFEIAMPELKKYGFRGVYFVMTVSLGRPGYMSKDQVRQLSDEGNVIGSHTWDHHNARNYAGDDWITQVEKPSRQLAGITGKPVEYFAYPFGLWNKEAIQGLKGRGFKGVFQLSEHRDESDPLFTIRRIIVPGSWSAARMLRVMRSSFR